MNLQFGKFEKFPVWTKKQISQILQLRKLPKKLSNFQKISIQKVIIYFECSNYLNK